MSRRVESLEQSWADRLGLDSPADVETELRARFDHLIRFVLDTGEMPPPGRGVSAEAATAHGELWVLNGVLIDARRALAGQGVDR